MTARAFRVRRAAMCPQTGSTRPHRWQSGDRYCLTVAGSPGLGVVAYLGCCRACGVPLLVLGPYGTDRHAACYELPDAVLAEG
ncbi:MAG TPA: hypothetical protein VFM55_04090 [Micromonosporaceae bacterium]|nr:hypothetical protein [Micromonosporaceae bacterium]